jgi:hypothetical protein
MAETEYIGELQKIPDTDVEVPGALYDNFNRAFGWMGSDEKPTSRSRAVMDYIAVAGTPIARPKSTLEILTEYCEGRIDLPQLGWNYGAGFIYSLFENIYGQKPRGIKRAQDTMADIRKRSEAVGDKYIAYLKEQAKAGATNATATITDMQARLDVAESISKRVLAEKAFDYLR